MSLTEDFGQMFREIALAPQEQDYHRFLMENDSGQVEECCVSRLESPPHLFSPPGSSEKQPPYTGTSFLGLLRSSTPVYTFMTASWRSTLSQMPYLSGSSSTHCYPASGWCSGNGGPAVLQSRTPSLQTFENEGHLNCWQAPWIITRLWGTPSLTPYMWLLQPWRPSCTQPSDRWRPEIARVFDIMAPPRPSSS